MAGSPQLANVLTIGRLASGALALPAQIQNQQAQHGMLTTQLTAAGFTPEQISSLAPAPPIQLPGGQFGRFVAGVGQTGSILSGLFGNPIEAPRPDLSSLLGIQNLALNKKQEDRAAAQQAFSQDIQTKELALSQAAGGRAQRQLALLERTSQTPQQKAELRAQAIAGTELAGRPGAQAYVLTGVWPPSQSRFAAFREELNLRANSLPGSAEFRGLTDEQLQNAITSKSDPFMQAMADILAKRLGGDAGEGLPEEPPPRALPAPGTPVPGAPRRIPGGTVTELPR